MILLFSPTTSVEVTIFFVALIAFVLSVQFFKDSRRRLEEVFPGITGSCTLPFGINRNDFLLSKRLNKKPEENEMRSYRPALALRPDTASEELKSLRAQLQQQQRQLEKVLEQLQLSGQNGEAEIKTTDALYGQTALKQSHMWLAEDGFEMQRLKQRDLYAQSVRTYPTGMEAAFEKTYDHMQQTEVPSCQVVELTVQLEQAEEAKARLERTLREKEEKLHVLVLENVRLHDAFHGLQEDPRRQSGNWSNC